VFNKVGLGDEKQKGGKVGGPQACSKPAVRKESLGCKKARKRRDARKKRALTLRSEERSRRRRLPGHLLFM